MSDKKTPLDSHRPASPPPSYKASTSQNNGTPTPPKLPLPRGPFPLDLPVLNSLRSKRVILASASPRRKQLLSQIGLPVEVLPSQFAEDLSKTLAPFEYVHQTATQKALMAYRQALDDPARGDPAALIAADTVVVSGVGQILEKPRSAAHHEAMLKELRLDAHLVLTAVAVIAPLASARAPGYVLETAVEETTVRFDRAVSDDLLRAYVRTREGADKAGGYGIQGMGALLVERVEGCYENVVGLPLRTTLRLLEKVVAKADESDSDEEDDEEEVEGS